MSDVQELLRRRADPDEYKEIRELWKRHSIAEENRDVAGLLATLTDDCVYEIVGAGHAHVQGQRGLAGRVSRLHGAYDWGQPAGSGLPLRR